MERPFTLVEALSATSRGAPHLAELAALRVVEGEVQASLATLVCPPVPVDDGVLAETGLSDGELRTGVFAAQALEQLIEFAGDTWIFVHDAERVGGLLAFEAARQGSSLPGTPLVCILELARRHLDEACIDLAQQTEALGLDQADLGDPGRALGRAVHAWKILEACLERAGQPDEAALLASLAKNPGGAALSSLTQLAPGGPRMSPRLRPLERARDAGDEVTLVYGDGNDHPARLAVRPGFLFERRGKGYLEAECLRSGALKTYLLERVRKVL